MADNPYAKFATVNPYAKFAVATASPAAVAPIEDTRPDWVKRDDDYLLMTTAPVGAAPPPAEYGKMISGFVPGVGAASAAFGKELEFGDEGSMLPTGIKDVPTLKGNMQAGNYGEAALQGLGVLPDVGYAAKAIPSVIKTAAKVPSGIANLPETVSAFRAAREKVPLTSERVANPLTKTGSSALDELRAAFESGALTPERLEAKLRQLGPGAVPADVDALSALHSLAARSPGKSSMVAARTLGAREATTPTRFSDAINTTLSDHGYHETINALDAIEGHAVSPLYKLANDSKIPVWNDKIGELIQDPKIRSGLKDSIENEMSIARARGEKPQLSDWAVTSFNEAGDPVLSGVPNIKLIDAAKRALDARMEKFRHPVTRQLEIEGNRDAQATLSLRRSLVNEADDVAEKNPETGVSFYKEARAESERYKKLRDALKTGYGAFDNVAEDNAKIVKGNPEKYLDPLGPEELDLAQRGLKQRIIERVKSKSETPETIVKLFSSKETRDKIRPFFSSNEDFNKFRMTTIAEARKLKTARQGDIENAAMRVGKDASELTNKSTDAADVAGLAVDAATMGKTALWRRALNFAADKFTADKRPIADELADFLYTTDAAKRARVMSRMRGDSYLDPVTGPARGLLPRP